MPEDTQRPTPTPRDRDLLLPDDYLTEIKLDKLWYLFCAREQGPDAQVVFVRLINAVRRSYLNAAGSSIRHRSWALQASGYTPSESTEAGERTSHDQLSDPSTLVGTLERAINGCSLDCPTCLQNDRQVVKGTRVAIRSADYTDCYIQIVPDQLSVRVSKAIGGWETFELIRHPGGMMSFKSTTSPEVYLSADGSTVEGSKLVNGGAGSVTCQPACGLRERFWLRMGINGRMWIEPVEFPGRFLMCIRDSAQVRLQGTKGNLEEFHLIVLG